MVKLDRNQLKAVKDESKYLMIIAGAGTGKTTVLSEKVRYLKNKNKNDTFLVISFTNKTVDELKLVLNGLYNLNIDVMTFHKLGLYILKKYGLKFEIYNNQESFIYNYIINTFDDIKKSFKSYLYKSNKKSNKRYINNNIDFEKFYNLIYKFFTKYKNQIKIYDDTPIINYMNSLIDSYHSYLSNNNYIDFDMMIDMAIKYIDKTNIDFKYIFIDEYQDISNKRFELIDKIVKKCDSNLCVVGDDWQTIYSFSGSNIDLFLNFKNKYNCNTITINKTYRNSIELLNVVGKFIMKNTNQIKKELKSDKKLKKPIEIIYYNDFINKDKNKFNKLISILDKIEDDKTILLLGRYNKDKLFLYKYFKINENKIIYKNKKIIFLTIHTSKGLGFDYVILLNNEDGINGFPSLIIDDKLIAKYFKNDEAEERRLFYVALTRTKNKVYLLTPYNNESLYIKEIKSMIK